MDREPVWVGAELAKAIHQRQLAEHGGLSGVRDESALESALARPRQMAVYSTDADLRALAAAYAFGLARNHPFADGNKRTAYVVCRAFLVLNGRDFLGSLVERYPVFLGVADGTMTERDLAEWLRAHTRESA